MDKTLEKENSDTHHHLPDAPQSNLNPAGTKQPLPDLINGPKTEYLKIGVRLYEASIKCDWEVANGILVKKPELVKYSITENGETALHIAASAKGPKNVEQFVKNLVDLMSKDDLVIVNKNHNTALYLAAAAGNVETVKIMVEKNKTLVTIPGGGGMVPLYAAALFGNEKVVQYLYGQSQGLRDDFWTSKNRGWLLEKCVESDMFDIALDIVKKFPQIGRVSNVLGVLARKPEAFREKESNIIERTINSVAAFIHLKTGTPEKENKALQLLRTVWEDIVQMNKNDVDRILRGTQDPIMSDTGRVIHTTRLDKHLNKLQVETQNITKDKNQVSKLKDLVSEHVLDMHDEIQLLIKENKMASGKENQVLELQKLISEYIVKIHDETKNLFTQKAGTPDHQAHKLQQLINQRIANMRHAIENYPKKTFSSRVLFVAAEVGNTAFLVELIRLYPDLIWKINDNGLSIFHIAVEHRHEGIYNLLYEIGAMKDMITPMRDTQGNNMLHLVGKSAKEKRLEDVSGVALQMQRELLWFREVKKMIPPSYRERKNEDDLTPHELFTKEHKELVSQGEKWMKGTASQCMVVAALIATIVFAAAFTVPGGYAQTDDRYNGIPVFRSKATFVVFVVADAISLFASSASILIFLSILTSRYAERDFLESIPNKLMAGLLTLFISIATMTLAFGVSFFVLYQQGFLWIPILIAVFAVLPVILYLCLQYGLFFDIIRSTYISRYLFKPKKHVLYYENPKV